MEKRKTNLTVEDFEDKKYGAGKRYTRFNTSEGWISSFDKKTIEKLKDSVNKEVSVEIMTGDDDREKITKFFGEAEDSDEDSEDEAIDKKPVKPKEAFSGIDYNPTTMYVSYAKDVFGILWSENLKLEEPSNEGAIMKLSCDLIKKAHKEFTN